MKKWLAQKKENAWRRAEKDVEVLVIGLGEQLALEREALEHVNDRIDDIENDTAWFSDEESVAEIDVLSQEVERRSKRITELLKQLDSARELKKKAKARSVSPDAVFTGIVSLASVLMIINAERVGIVASKAIGFVVKPRL